MTEQLINPTTGEPYANRRWTYRVRTPDGMEDLTGRFVLYAHEEWVTNESSDPNKCVQHGFEYPLFTAESAPPPDLIVAVSVRRAGADADTPLATLDVWGHGVDFIPLCGLMATLHDYVSARLRASDRLTIEVKGGGSDG